LGDSILAICKSMNDIDQRGAVLGSKSSAKGGILVFFPSYAQMDGVIERWKYTAMYDKLKLAVGYIVVEPKGSGAPSQQKRQQPLKEQKQLEKLGFMSDNSYAKQNSDVPEDEGFGGIISEFESAVASAGSCLLLAVCRYAIIKLDFS
jgi:hypothetical protein